jgi:hypothetical protein
MGAGSQRHTPAVISPGKTPGTHCTGDLVAPRVGMDSCGKSCPLPVFDPRAVHSQSLYRLSYPGPCWEILQSLYIVCRRRLTNKLTWRADGMILTGDNRSTLRPQRVSVTFPIITQHGLLCDRTRTSAVRGWDVRVTYVSNKLNCERDGWIFKMKFNVEKL